MVRYLKITTTSAGYAETDESRSRCLLPYESVENATYCLPQNEMNASYPWDYEQKGWSQCSRHVVPDAFNQTTMDRYVNASTGDAPIQKLVSPNGFDSPGLLPCEGYVYDRSRYKSTTTSEVHLACFVLFIRRPLLFGCWTRSVESLTLR